MKKVLDSVKNAFGETTAVLGEGYLAASELLKETLSNFYDVKDLTREKMATLANDMIALAPIIETTGYRAKEINIGVGIPPRMIFHFEKFADISEEEIARILSEHADKKLLSVIVNTLVSADAFQKKITLGSFSFNEISIELGVPPEVNVKFVNAATL
jgi:hypothetical protein